MMQFIDAHPILFGILAIPVVCTVCLLVICFALRVKFKYRSRP